MQVCEDLKHPNLLAEKRSACFSTACTAEQSRNDVSVLNKVFTMASIQLYV